MAKRQQADILKTQKIAILGKLNGFRLINSMERQFLFLVAGL